MKLLFCTSCGDITAPFRKDREVRYCRCGRHYIWWEDGEKGIVRVHDTRKINDSAYLLGVHNGFLMYPHSHTKEIISLLLETTPDYYIFKTQNSLIIRFRPGESSDSAWAAELPKTHAGTPD